MNLTKSRTDARVASWLALAICLMLILYGATIFIGQLLYWLRFGHWLAIPLSELSQPNPGDAAPFPLSIIPHSEGGTSLHPTSWLGLAKIEKWLVDISLPVWCLIGAWISGACAANLAETAEKGRRDAQASSSAD